MSTPITCTFKVPSTEDEYAYMGENGIGIKFSDMLDPTNANIRSFRPGQNIGMYAGEITSSAFKNRGSINISESNLFTLFRVLRAVFHYFLIQLYLSYKFLDLLVIHLLILF